MAPNSWQSLRIGCGRLDFGSSGIGLGAAAGGDRSRDVMTAGGGYAGLPPIRESATWVWVKIKPPGYGPQGLVVGSIYQTSILATHFLTHSHMSLSISAITGAREIPAEILGEDEIDVKQGHRDFRYVAGYDRSGLVVFSILWMCVRTWRCCSNPAFRFTHFPGWAS